MRHLGWTLALSLTGLPLMAQAEEWVVLDGPGISQALTARVLIYPEGVAQDFRRDGRTIRLGDRGRWWVEGDLYCESWGRLRPICAEVDQRDDRYIRFREETGFIRIGFYADL